MADAPERAGSGTRRRAINTVTMLLGLVLVVAAGLALAYPLWWNHRSTTVGNKLKTNFNTDTTVAPGPGATSQPAAVCVASSATIGPGTIPAGLITIPVLKMTAPVLQGLSDDVLNVAAGHYELSPWPGGAGESIVESHDVSYFSQISTLKNGATVEWLDHCRNTYFKVIGHEVVPPGTQLPPPKDGHPGLALITCYPTDALYYVQTRFVLLTEEISAGKATQSPPKLHVVQPVLKDRAPASLVAQGLNLPQNEIFLGTMSFSGSPSPGWKQGPASLELEALALDVYFGTQKAIAADNLDWWKAISVPGLPLPPAWSIYSKIYVNEDMKGSTPVQVTLSSDYVTFVAVPSHAYLVVKSVTVK